MARTQLECIRVPALCPDGVVRTAVVYTSSIKSGINGTTCSIRVRHGDTVYAVTGIIAFRHRRYRFTPRGKNAWVVSKGLPNG